MKRNFTCNLHFGMKNAWIVEIAAAMSTKHRFLAFARARVRSTPPGNVGNLARLAPRLVQPGEINTTRREYQTALVEREYDSLPESTLNAVEGRGMHRSTRMGNRIVRTTALTSSLDDLADEEVIQVLEEALDIAQEDSTSPSGSTPFTSTPFTPSLGTPTSASAISDSDSVVVATNSGKLRYLLHLGATHLVHLVLGDILTRSFGRLEIVYEALEACAGGVEGRYVAEMVEMLDDSYLRGNGDRTLSLRTVRRVLDLVV
ncbi:hypothetical protein QFC20_002759 [Naganishia adeliensis]|uniref:Uncharacterized protein n=1 Tax=Naganishia adeliensis TaxID=92952 RepID=A0ACC2WH83_9TREE|nr:hypothetical protein QFC20_002759 [Naganishia adeliensis]